MDPVWTHRVPNEEPLRCYSGGLMRQGTRNITLEDRERIAFKCHVPGVTVRFPYDKVRPRGEPKLSARPRPDGSPGPHTYVGDDDGPSAA